MQEIELLQAMMDDEFQKILQEDVILNELEKEKFNTKNAFWEVRSILSPVFEIDGYKVSAITPAIWSVLYTLDNAYTNESEITDFDTDLFFYLLATGLKNIDDDFLITARGYVEKLGLNYESVKMDLLYLYKLAFQPLEMIPVERRITDAEESGFGADWLTMVVQIACNATNKTSDDVLYNMSLTECNYYLINEIRKTDKGQMYSSQYGSSGANSGNWETCNINWINQDYDQNLYLQCFYNFSPESFQKLVEKLAPLSDGQTACTVYFSKYYFNQVMTEQQKSQITKKGWNISTK